MIASSSSTCRPFTTLVATQSKWPFTINPIPEIGMMTLPNGSEHAGGNVGKDTEQTGRNDDARNDEIGMMTLPNDSEHAGGNVGKDNEQTGRNGTDSAEDIVEKEINFLTLMKKVPISSQRRHAHIQGT